jgi:hypothetical protein
MRNQWLTGCGPNDVWPAALPLTEANLDRLEHSTYSSQGMKVALNVCCVFAFLLLTSWGHTWKVLQRL